MICKMANIIISKSEYDNIIKDLKPKLTSEFLDTLMRCNQFVGWSADQEEVYHFLVMIHKFAETEMIQNFDFYEMIEE